MCWRRSHFSPHSILRCCRPYPKLARADKAPGMGRAMQRLARFVTRKWPEPIYALRRELGLPPGKNPIFDAKHSPNLVLALFSRVLGTEQKDWPQTRSSQDFVFTMPTQATRRCPRSSRNFSPRASRRRVHAGLGRGAGRGRFLRAVGTCRKEAGRARGAAHRHDDPRNRPQQELPDSICVAEYAPYSGLFPRAVAGGASGRRRNHGAMPSRRPAHAHHALLARPARQRAAHEAHGRGARHPALAVQAVARGAQVRTPCSPIRSMRSELAQSRRRSRPRERRQNRVRRAGPGDYGTS
jgi:hypothetical protein